MSDAVEMLGSLDQDTCGQNPIVGNTGSVTVGAKLRVTMHVSLDSMSVRALGLGRDAAEC